MQIHSLSFSPTWGQRRDDRAGVNMESHHIQVNRTARYFTLGPEDGSVSQVWFLLHGYGQLAANFLKPFRSHVGEGRLLVALEGLSRFYLRGTAGRVGASWMTREDRLEEIDDQLSYLHAVWEQVVADVGTESVQLNLFGFSQGTATACRFASRCKMPIRKLVLWAGGVSPDLDLVGQVDRWNSMDITLVTGSQDAMIPQGVVEEQRRWLAESGVNATFRSFEGGHELNTEVLREILE
jgi:predicted esterase